MVALSVREVWLPSTSDTATYKQPEQLLTHCLHLVRTKKRGIRNAGFLYP